MKGTVKAPSFRALRRIALKSQGLTGKRRMGAGPAGVLGALERLGYIQIDTISVVARAHDHTGWVRAGKFDSGHFNALIERQEAFEYWYHAASYLPMRDFRFALHRMRSIKSGERHWHRSKDAKLMAYVRDRIAAEGPLYARDFESPPRTSSGWWDWKPAKRALEQLYMEGDLMIASRDGFAKRYDLPERVLPSDIDLHTPTIDELAEHLIDNGLRANGFATAASFMQNRRGMPLRSAVHETLSSGVAAGRLVTFEHAGEQFYASPETLESHTKPADVARILSPFDNSVIFRSRCRGIFDFDFRLECYVSEPNRRWGYYSLPILYGDRFVGRMDCKAHRRHARFEIKNLVIERDVDDGFGAAFEAATREYAAFTGCDAITVTRATPGRFTHELFKGE